MSDKYTSLIKRNKKGNRGLPWGEQNGLGFPFTKSKSKMVLVNTLPKIITFLWRLVSNALAMKANIFFRHLSPSPLCHNFPETNEHILFTCEWTLKVWFAHPISYRVPVNQISTADQWIELFFLIPSWLRIGFIVNSIYTCDLFTLAHLEAPVSLYFHTFCNQILPW